MNEVDKDKLLSSAESMRVIGMSIFYVATMLAFYLVGSLAGDSVHTGEFTAFTYIAYASLIISLVSSPFLIASVVKYNKYRKLLKKDA